MFEEQEERIEKEVKKEQVSLKRYEEIEERIDRAIDEGDVDTILRLNDLTLARNLQEHLSKPQQKLFRVVYVAFKSDRGVVKRAGVYNSLVITNPEDAEDVLIGEDFENEDGAGDREGRKSRRQRRADARTG